MTGIDFLGLKLDVCPQCAGIWFDDGELTALAKGAPEMMMTLDDRFKPGFEILNQPAHSKTCPRCEARLESFRYQYSSPVEIDSCSVCNGVFVEDQELTSIQDFIDHESSVQVTAAMKARAHISEGEPVDAPEEDLNKSVSTLLYALSHWRDKKETK